MIKNLHNIEHAEFIALKGPSLKVKIGDIFINYSVTGEGYPIVLLHGWGGSISSFAPVHKYLESNFKIFSIDLPGFGDSETPTSAWTTEDYANFLKTFFNNTGISNPIIFGHSFGGRLAIRLASSIPVKKLILIDSAGIKPSRTISYYLKVYSYKSASRFLKLPIIRIFTANILNKMRNKFGSKDYKDASPILREILVKAVNEDLSNLLPNISSPTLLVWGEMDTATPISDALIMNELIPDSGLIRFPGAGHFSYLERLDDFLVIIDSFLKNEALTPK